MSQRWRQTSIADLCDIYDGPHATPTKTDNGPVFLGISCLNNGRLDLSQAAHLSEKDFKRWTRRVTPRPGDIVFSYETRLGEAAMIPEGLKCCLGRRMGLLRVDPCLVDSRFLLYSYLGPDFQRTIHARSVHGATVSRILLTELGDYPLAVPPLPIQRRIAGILGALDDKIELNRRMNKTLEEMAQALYKHWFVDFGPLQAGEFVDSELGPIPRGWEVKPLTEVIDFKEGPGIRNWQYTNTDEGTRFINIRCIKNGDLDLRTANRITNEEAYGRYAHFQLQPDDLIVSTSGTLGRYAIIRSEHLPLVLNTSVIRMRPIPQNCTLPFLIGYVETGLQVELEVRASGSAQRNFGPMHLKQISMLVPVQEVLGAHNNISEKWLRMSLNLRRESNNIAAIRDYLLPKLLSGEIDVEAAEEQAEDIL